MRCRSSSSAPKRAAQFCVSPAGKRGSSIPDADDPDIANSGDGSFHPVDLQEAVAALDAIEPAFTAAVEAMVYILPMPRRGLLDSSAGDGAIYLSPGVRPLAPAQIRSLVAHEFGHVVQRLVLPDTDDEGWSAYRQLRGIADESVFYAGAVHKNRPHEIFAEDFRYLFGGQGANLSGSIENAELVLPDAVQGLREWMAELVLRAGAAGGSRGFELPRSVRVADNDPLVGSGGRLPVHVEMFDAAGRLVRSLEQGNDPRRATTSHGGLGRPRRAGRIAATGVYFAVLSAGSLTSVEKLNVVR